jgi:predicted nucleic acid-binding protein
LRRVLFDTNVLLDVLLRRQPHFGASARALDAVAKGQAEGFVSGHAVATLAYLLQRQLGKARGKAVLLDLLAHLQIAPVTDRGVRQALAGTFADLEDAICHAAAEEVGVALIVTRNTRDFAGGSIPAVSPEAFIWP